MTVKDLKDILDEMPDDNEIVIVSEPLSRADENILDDPDKDISSLHGTLDFKPESISNRQNVSVLFCS